MTSDKLIPKPTAILSADVKGYNRLMGEEEEWTLQTLNSYKGLIGNLVGSTGAGWLVRRATHIRRLIIY